MSENRGRGRPRGANGPGSVSVQMRLPARTVAALLEIGRGRGECQHGGIPSPAKVVVMLADEWQKNNGGGR